MLIHQSFRIGATLLYFKCHYICVIFTSIMLEKYSYGNDVRDVVRAGISKGPFISGIYTKPKIIQELLQIIRQTVYSDNIYTCCSITWNFKNGVHMLSTRLLTFFTRNQMMYMVMKLTNVWPTFPIWHSEQKTRGRLNIKMSSYQLNRSHDRLIFNMGILISGKDGLYIETGPSSMAVPGDPIAMNIKPSWWVCNLCSPFLFLFPIVSDTF